MTVLGELATVGWGSENEKFPSAFKFQYSAESPILTGVFMNVENMPSMREEGVFDFIL